MTPRGEKRRLVLGLIAALSVNAALLALMAPRGREVGWPERPDTEVAVQLALRREAPTPVEIESVRSKVGRGSAPPQPSPRTSKTPPVNAPAPPTPAPEAHGAPAGIPSPPPDQGAKTAGPTGGGDADLRAKTALALRRLGACSRVNSGLGDAQDKEMCKATFAAANGEGIDAIAADKRAGYDAARAKAGYLVPADAADPDFVTSAFKRGGTVVKGHAGCSLVEGQWRCVGR